VYDGGGSLPFGLRFELGLRLDSSRHSHAVIDQRTII
jgi:hypothetical protein